MLLTGNQKMKIALGSLLLSFFIGFCLTASSMPCLTIIVEMIVCKKACSSLSGKFSILVNFETRLCL